MSDAGQSDGKIGRLDSQEKDWGLNPSICIDGRFIQDHYPGIGRYTYNLIDALGQVAPEEKFVVLHNPALKNTRHDIGALERYPNIGFVRSNIPTRSLREQFQLSLSQARLLHSPYFVKPYFLRLPSIVTIFDLIPLRSSGSASVAARWLFRGAITAALRSSARIIVPSASTRDDLVALFHTAPGKIAVTPLAADPRFKPVSESAAKRLRETYRLPEKYVLYVGINKPHKNLRTLVAAWERAGVDVGLVIAGAWDERYNSGVEGQESRVRLLQDVDDAYLPALYSSASVFVLPSWYEGFGLPLLEAMACGAPVISSSASSLPEVGGDAPLYFDPHDIDGLAHVIARVTGYSAIQDEMRAKSLARAKVFSWERTARETLAVYGSVQVRD